jgi:hypothetical protein
MADIRLAGQLMATPRARTNIYRLRPPLVNERTVRAMAQRLGLQGKGRLGALRSDADKLTYAEGHLELTVYGASGGIQFRDRSRWQVDDRTADLRIEDEAAHRLAQNFVRKYRLAARGESAFFKAARLRVGEANRETREAFERTIDVAVALQRLVNKVPVDGPGGRIVVYLDHAGQATGFDRLWRDIAGVHRRGESLRPPQSAIDEMARQWDARRGIVEVQQVRFGYFEEGWRSSQRYLQPAYVIVGVATSVDSRVRRKTVYVAAALTNSVGRLTPPLREKPPQSTRRDVR